ncbi:hypothetical protein [Spirosoma sp.]|uniref:hypothetical protein n=1 Tax=Spirosoma sp. TaxID=1899569 RepID=UPI0026377B4B|nr:hypothetical protein [Spirosoma sp.]MCX6217604.1 hypothetical protein [Spirosoma sp.]
MAKMFSELRSSDMVVLNFSARTQRNEVTGKDTVIDPEKQMEVPFGYWENITAHNDDFTPDEENPQKGYSRTINRDIELLGLSSPISATTDTNDNFQTFSVVPFETLEQRHQAKVDALTAQSESLAQREAEIRAEAYAKAMADFAASQIPSPAAPEAPVEKHDAAELTPAQKAAQTRLAKQHAAAAEEAAKAAQQLAQDMQQA